jgi:hypothetical protein
VSDRPQTLVDEVKIPLEETLELSIEDDWQTAERKGLYEEPEAKVVVIEDEQGEVIAVTTAGKLRGEIVPRSWQGPLSEVRERLPTLPVVSAGAQVASLDALVQTIRDADWLLVVDEERRPVGVLARQVVVEKYLPPIDPTQEVYRRGEARLWGDPTEGISLWYCWHEQRVYLQHDVTPDERGVMRCPNGHPVERQPT